MCSRFPHLVCACILLLCSFAGSAEEQLPVSQRGKITLYGELGGSAIAYSLNAEFASPLNNRWKASARLGFCSLPHYMAFPAAVQLVRGHPNRNRAFDVGVGIVALMFDNTLFHNDFDIDGVAPVISAGWRWETKRKLFLRANLNILVPGEFQFAVPVWPGFSAGFRL